MKKYFIRNISAIVISLCAVLAFSGTSAAQLDKGTLLREVVHGKSLERTATCESPDRKVAIYLPPSYRASPEKHYPVIYLLHGIGDTEENWVKIWTDVDDGYATLQDVMDKGIAEGKFGEMIVVMPDERTKWYGSFYVNSAATGNWDDYTTRELVNYVDGKFRTLPRTESRGISGHSMGGYGAITLGMKHPDVFSVVYGINPAIMGWGGDLTIESPAFSRVLEVKTFEDLGKTNDLYTMATVTLAQAFSPNPNNPPFFVDFPFVKFDGKLRPFAPALTKWEENFPVLMVKTYAENLKKLRGLKFDSGYEDEFKFIPVNSRALSAELTKNGVGHIFEEYNGDHRNRMWSRNGRLYNEVLPFFWLLLDHNGGKK